MQILKAITITIGLTTSLSCFAQGGGSVNGPDLKGNMIPVYSDGEIPAEKLNIAVGVCFKRMGEQVLGTILGRAVKLGACQTLSDQDIFSDNGFKPASLGKNEKAVHYYYSTSNSESPSIVIQKEDTIRMRPQTDGPYRYSFSMMSSNYDWSGHNSDTENKLSLSYSFEPDYSELNMKSISLIAHDFPYISYELKDKSIYGELGEQIEKKLFVSNIRLQYKTSNTDTTFHLKAQRQTDQVEVNTPMTIDTIDLAQCIKSNLQ